MKRAGLILGLLIAVGCDDGGPVPQPTDPVDPMSRGGVGGAGEVPIAKPAMVKTLSEALQVTGFPMCGAKYPVGQFRRFLCEYVVVVRPLKTEDIYKNGIRCEICDIWNPPSNPYTVQEPPPPTPAVDCIDDHEPPASVCVTDCNECQRG